MNNTIAITVSSKELLKQVRALLYVINSGFCNNTTELRRSFR